MPRYCPRCGESLLSSQLGQTTTKGSPRKTARRAYEDTPTKKKRKPSAYSIKYGKAFKRLAPKYKKKNGSWKQDGFKRCQKAAHKAVRK